MLREGDQRAPDGRFMHVWEGVSQNGGHACASGAGVAGNLLEVGVTLTHMRALVLDAEE